jgi:NitT/TauT family transport system permease protein
MVDPTAPPGHAASSLRFRGGGFVIETRRGAAILGVAVLVALWQAASALGFASPLFLPSPFAIGRALAELLLIGQLAADVAASLSRIVVGWLIGTAAGLLVGLLLGLVSLARAAGLPIVSALFPIPKIALLPLFILWFGIGEPSKIATIALGVFFPTVVSTMGGVDHVPRGLIRMAQSFGVPTPGIVRTVVLPGALPGILSGFRVSAAIALILVVAAEMIGAERGLGAFILTAGNLMQTDRLLAGVVVLSALGLAVGAGLTFLERRLLAWR